MKPVKLILVIAIIGSFISATSVGNSYILSKDYVVTINGTSNLHNWNENVVTATGNAKATWNTDGSFSLDALTIKMQVTSIKSDMGSIMNNNTYKALKSDVDPEIILVLSLPINSIQSAGSEKMVPANCNLTIAGVTKAIIMQVKVSNQAHGKLFFEGSQSINMTDYNIAPPTALFGTLKTGKLITISFKTNYTITD
jgi:hypothetical protein